VTGSNGKTTTCALTHEILRRTNRSWLGGNIGVSLLDGLPKIRPRDTVVLELSSFQLDMLGAIGRSPRIAVVTNLTPNHLDRHGTMDAYANAKGQIIAHQGNECIKVLNADDPRVSRFAGAARTRTFSLGCRGDTVFHRDRIYSGYESIDVRRRRLPGDFNVANMLAATAAAFAATDHPCRIQAAEDAFSSFTGVEHRLEYVGERRGVRFYNDSIATNPESTIAALDALPGPILLIMGGYDKQLPFNALDRHMQKVRFVSLYGATARKIDAVLTAVDRCRVKTLDEAVRAGTRRARPGDTVLFSPACASFDQFRNFAERGRIFKSIIQRVTERRTRRLAS